ncbi:MAG: phosphohydrolase, partial [Muribaculaceae bacterium]|nr:phosphohydrolase [Muribaculaceae bacterium]
MNLNVIYHKYYEEGSALLDLLLTHSELVARKALDVAAHAGLDIDKDFVYNVAMLHDIGIFRCNAPGIFCLGKEPYIRHGVIG